MSENAERIKVIANELETLEIPEGTFKAERLLFLAIELGAFSGIEFTTLISELDLSKACWPQNKLQRLSQRMRQAIAGENDDINTPLSTCSAWLRRFYDDLEDESSDVVVIASSLTREEPMQRKCVPVITETKPDDGSQKPALTKSERLVLLTLQNFDASMLPSITDIATEMNPKEQLSEKKTGEAIRKLIKADLAERPEGERLGSRLTLAGRRLAAKIAD